MSEPMTMLDGARAADGLTCEIAERGPVGQITLKGDLAAPALSDAVRAITGTGLPAPLSALFEGEAGTVWMAPDEVLLLLPHAQVGDAVIRLSQALEGHHHMVLDVSDARAVLRVSGKGAQELMAKGAPCDVSDSAFPPGTARRTHFAEIAVGLWRREATVWELVCFQSYAPHLFAWLVGSAAEGTEVGYFDR